MIKNSTYVENDSQNSQCCFELSLTHSPTLRLSDTTTYFLLHQLQTNKPEDIRRNCDGNVHMKDDGVTTGPLFTKRQTSCHKSRDAVKPRDSGSYFSNRSGF